MCRIGCPMTMDTAPTRAEVYVPPHGVSAHHTCLTTNFTPEKLRRAEATSIPLLQAILSQDGDFYWAIIVFILSGNLTKQRICLPPWSPHHLGLSRGFGFPSHLPVQPSNTKRQRPAKPQELHVAMPEPISVLFVCLGNICRSPMAEGIFRHIAKEPQFQGKIDKIDSCGTGMYLPPQRRKE
jgi:hypothetical protein